MARDSLPIAAATAFAFISVLASVAGALEPEIVVLKSVKPQQQPGAVTSYGLSREDYQRIVRTVPSARGAIPLRVIERTARFGSRTVDVRAVGATESLASFQTLQLKSGSFLSKQDVVKLNNVAVISHRVASRLFGDADAVGKNVRLENQYLRVIGITTEKTATVYLPITTMRSRMGDVEVVRKAGAFEVEQFELSEIRIQVGSESAVATLKLISRLLESAHPTKDYRIERRRP